MEIRERTEEIVVPKRIEVVEAVGSKAGLFAQRSDEELLGYGVPAEWRADVRQADEDSLLELADHLPRKAAEALLELAAGGEPQLSRPVAAPGADPVAHPDAQRRFRVMADLDELARALEYPWDKWTIFLHPAQRELVERDYSVPARVSGSAGIGKTIVALRRAVFLARKHTVSLELRRAVEVACNEMSPAEQAAPQLCHTPGIVILADRAVRRSPLTRTHTDAPHEPARRSPGLDSIRDPDRARTGAGDRQHHFYLDPGRPAATRDA